jgi:hypothetical protein
MPYGTGTAKPCAPIVIRGLHLEGTGIAAAIACSAACVHAFRRVSAATVRGADPTSSLSGRMIPTVSAELAKALERLGLKPFIIFVNNEPTTSYFQCHWNESLTPYPKASQISWFASVMAPLSALFATREARGTLAAADLCSFIGDTNRIAFIVVNPDRTNTNKALSMSWWLSKHVQKYLDEQLDEEQLRRRAYRNDFFKINAARKVLEKL